MWEVCGMGMREFTAQAEHISEIFAFRFRIIIDDNGPTVFSL
jgi:hypothetical protein